MVDEGFDPRPLGFEARAGFGEPVPHDGLVDEGFAKGFALEDVGEGEGEGNAGLSGGADGDGEAFVVEVGHAGWWGVSEEASLLKENNEKIFKRE